MNDLVSVITATWQRPFQLARCMASVAAQTYRPVEHIIVSDGPEPLLSSPEFVDYVRQLDRSHPGYTVMTSDLRRHVAGAWWGVRAKAKATKAARGHLIGWLDDDDEYRREHISKLARALHDQPDAGFAFSKHWPDSPDVPTPGDNNGLQAFLARRHVAMSTPWRRTPYDGWDVVSRWLAAGVPYVHVPEQTIVLNYHDHVTPGNGRPLCSRAQLHIAMIESGQEVNCAYCHGEHDRMIRA